MLADDSPTRFVWPSSFVLTALPAIAPASALAQPAVEGQWPKTFDTQNVMIHAHVLPNGKVLFWSRRKASEGLDPHRCTPRIWDPKSGTFTATPQAEYSYTSSSQNLRFLKGLEVEGQE